MEPQKDSASAPVHSVVPRSDGDPRQCIYDAMNWMSGTISSEPPRDSEAIIAAYEYALKLDDKKAQETIMVIVQKLRVRNQTLDRIANAWRGSSERLRQACQMISAERG